MVLDFSEGGVDADLSSNVGVALDLIWSAILMGSAHADGTTTLGDWTAQHGWVIVSAGRNKVHQLPLAEDVGLPSAVPAAWAYLKLFVVAALLSGDLIGGTLVGAFGLLVVVDFAKREIC